MNPFIVSVDYNFLGFEVFKYYDIIDIKQVQRDLIFVDGVGVVSKRLEFLRIEKQGEIEHPDEL